MYQLFRPGMKRPAAVFGQHDENTLSQLADVATRAEIVSLQADGHVGYCMPIGGVAAYDRQVSVVGVGFDLACGNCAIRTDLRLEDVTDGISLEEFVANPYRLQRDRKLGGFALDIEGQISFGIGRKNRADDAPVNDPLFHDPAWWAIPNIGGYRDTLMEKARDQLGTVGSGNHYVDVFVDEAGAVWIGVHFGSRGLGHTIASAFLAISQGGNWGDRAKEQEVLLSIDQPSGHDYLALLNLAGRYAYAGREWVARKVVTILGGRELEMVHNHHNFCLPGDAIVPTPTGPKRMADVCAGDRVYAYDPATGLTETRVSRHWWSGRKPIYTISTRNRRLQTSGDHPILTVAIRKEAHPDRPWHERSTGTLRWQKASDVRRGDVIVCAEGYYRGDQAQGLDRARLLGAFLGDGWRRHDPGKAGAYTVGLAIGAAADDHTGRYLAVLEEQMPTAVWRNNAPQEFGLTGQSPAAWREAAEFGVHDYSPDREVPAWAFVLPPDEKRAVLAGYFDADGSLGLPETSNHGRGFVSSASRRLVDGLRELAISLGLQVTPVRSEMRTTNFGAFPVHHCQLSADSMAALDLWHAAKAGRQRITTRRRPQGLTKGRIGYLTLPPGSFAQRVLSVSVEEERDVYDLTVEHPNHSFVCDGVVVHNYWQETHDLGDGNGPREYMVVRKGATPAFPEQKGFVGGSMGDDAVILQGATQREPVTGRVFPSLVDPDAVEAQRASLFSTVHGAGRVMSRTEAAGVREKFGPRAGQLKIDKATGQPKRVGKITNEMLKEWLDRRGVILKGGGLDEAPQAYRRLPDVLSDQGPTIEVLHTLRPIIVVMASAREHDPYKD